jgi:signal transduction histidine kinase/CheY-like chemotaxis protein
VEVPSDHDIILALGDDLPVGLWVGRVPDGELIYANRTLTELLGRGVRDGMRAGGQLEPYGLYTRDGARYPDSKLPFARVLAERRVVTAEDITIRRPDGKHVEIRSVAWPVGDPLTHVIVALFDISREVAAERARAESEKRLRRAQRFETIGTLAGGLAHDFNNLIFGIKLLAAEVAVTEQDPKRRAAMELIDDITERSALLTRSLLGFTRRSPHRAMPVSVNDVAMSLTELLGRTLSGVDLTFELEASDRGTIVGDHAQLEQMIMNLVLNAHGAVHGTGRVIVRTCDRATPGDPAGPRFVVLEIKDDGPGILSEASERVVDPQVAPPEPPLGSGLDLETVFSMIESLDGTLEVDAGIDGRGTTMRVVLPATRPAPDVKARTTLEGLPRGSGLILVVDDDQMVRKVVAGSLGSLGYKTIEARSGTNAIEIFRARHAEIRAVVLDMMMPGMPGRATYLALREVDSNVSVMLMSGHALNEQVQEILDLGVKSFVSKPYSLAGLAAAMAELVRE